MSISDKLQFTAKELIRSNKLQGMENGPGYSRLVAENHAESVNDLHFDTRPQRGKYLYIYSTNIDSVNLQLKRWNGSSWVDIGSGSPAPCMWARVDGSGSASDFRGLDSQWRFGDALSGTIKDVLVLESDESSPIPWFAGTITELT